MTFLRVIRVNDLRDIKVLVKLCTDLSLEGKYNLIGKAMGILPLTGNLHLCSIVPVLTSCEGGGSGSEIFSILLVLGENEREI